MPEQYLVIDDDQTSNLICRYMIKKFDPAASVIVFEDSVMALQSLSGEIEGVDTEKKTVVFLDMNMPAMTGLEFLELLKKNKPDILKHLEIYILSSSIEDFSTERIKYPNLAGFLTKPLSKSHLQEIGKKTIVTV